MENYGGEALVVDCCELDGKEDDKLVRLMIENNVLECEKKSAEMEVERWKQKCKDLEARNVELENMLLSIRHSKVGKIIRDDKDPVSSSYRDSPCLTPCMERASSDGRVRIGSGARKRLAFDGDGSTHKKITPSTPAGMRLAPTVVTYISDSEDECLVDKVNISGSEGQGTRMSDAASPHGSLGAALHAKRTSPINIDESDDQDMDDFGGSFHVSVTPKQRRASKIVTSDSESQDDDIDNIPIGRLRDASPVPSASEAEDASNAKKKCRRRLVRLSHKEEHFATCRPESQSEMLEIVDSDDLDESDDGSDSDRGTLRDFIAGSSEESGGIGNIASHEAEDSSDSNLDFGVILSGIQRRKDLKLKWEFEGDMLADFGKDPELCMRAVCALYRQQTEDERTCKETLVDNHRGFSKFNARRGTSMAEFLLDGSEGDLKRSVKELQEYDPKALELCRTLANRYSKQLFEIYQRKEDPYWC